MNEGRPVLASQGGDITRFTDVLEWGYHLANTPVGIDPAKQNLWEAKGWKDFVEHMPTEKQAYPMQVLRLLK